MDIQQKIEERLTTLLKDKKGIELRLNILLKDRKELENIYIELLGMIKENKRLLEDLEKDV